MEPRVRKIERKLQLTYDLPHRVRCARIYPVQAPNGSTLVLYGHDGGLTLLWRGGRKIKQRKTAPAASTDVIALDDSEDDAPQQDASGAVEFEDQEEEMDPDAPYPGIIQEMSLDLSSPVTHIAIPDITSKGSQQLPLLKQKAIVVAHTANGKVSLLQVPLTPPYPATSRDAVQAILRNRVALGSGTSGVNDIAVKVRTRFLDDSLLGHGSKPESTLYVAAVSESLRLWRLPILSGKIDAQEVHQQSVPLLSAATRISCHPSASSGQLFIVDNKHTVRVYDSAPPSDSGRPISRDSMSSSDEAGRWLTTFQAPYHALPQDHQTIPSRKKILDAKWVLGGRAILVLLEDGQWGIWDATAAAQTKKAVGEFVLQGFLGSASSGTSAEPIKQRKGSSKLAPMTPNTRKTKTENFFSGAAKAPGSSSRGGISVVASESFNGQAEESAMLWYNSELYTIPNMQQFWHRSMNVSGSGTGSLYSPGLTHIQDLSLLNENITSVAQFAAKSSSSGIGQMNTARDFLVSAEHRFIIQQTTRPPVSAKGLFDKLDGLPASAPTDRDQRMLDAGELDLGGMDRMLDSMANGATRTRKVGFAS